MPPYGSIAQPRETASRTERYHTVHELMVGIDFERAKRRLPRELFLAMQSCPRRKPRRSLGRVTRSTGWMISATSARQSPVYWSGNSRLWPLFQGPR